MRTIGILAGALALGAAVPALAQAPVAGTATQPGTWGRHGWVSGAGAAPANPAGPAPTVSAPTVATPAPAPALMPGPTPVATPVKTGVATPAMMPDAPPFQHRWMNPGAKVPKPWRDQRYALADWPAYGFPQPGPGMRWMRYYDDAALIDERGRVVDVRHDVAWDAPRAAAPAYGAVPSAPQPAYPAPALPVPGTVRTGPNTTVTTSVATVAPPVAAGGAWNGGEVVSVTPGYVITTTTRTSEVIRQPSRPSRRKTARR
jgi:hypothetical protein